MKKEYELVADFDEGELSGLFYTINVALEQKNCDLLDLEVCKSKVDEAFMAIACKRRFDKLNEESNTAIKYSRGGFTLDNHKFETLDEVERAWKMKAFI